MMVRYKRGPLSTWTARRSAAFPEPHYYSRRCGGCGHVYVWGMHPNDCDRRARAYRGEWNAFYDDIRGDPKRMRLARKYFACAVAELDGPAWWSR